MSNTSDLRKSIKAKRPKAKAKPTAKASAKNEGTASSDSSNDQIMLGLRSEFKDLKKRRRAT